MNRTDIDLTGEWQRPIEDAFADYRTAVEQIRIAAAAILIRADVLHAIDERDQFAALGPLIAQRAADMVKDMDVIRNKLQTVVCCVEATDAA